MTFIRTPASAMFAIEATRVALSQQELPVIGKADGPWLYMDTTVQPKEQGALAATRRVLVKFSVHGIDLKLESICRVQKMRSPLWDDSIIEIRPLDRRGTEQFTTLFRVSLVENQIIAELMMSQCEQQSLHTPS